MIINILPLFTCFIQLYKWRHLGSWKAVPTDWAVPKGNRDSDCHVQVQKLCCLGDIFNGIFFQNDSGLTFHFLRLHYPFIRRRKERREIHLCQKDHGLHSPSVISLFFQPSVHASSLERCSFQRAPNLSQLMNDSNM